MKITNQVQRLDAKEKICGENLYLEDMTFDNLYYARTLRSEIPRGEIASITYPLTPEGIFVVDWRDVLKNNEVAMIKTDMPIFAKDEVRYVGEPIALVVGQDKDEILAYMETIQVKYEPLPAVLSMTEAKKMDVIIEGTHNTYTDLCYTKGDLEGLKNCEVFEKIYQTPYQEQMYMEKQSIVATFDKEILTIIGSIQCPYYVKNALIHSTGYDPDKIVVKQSDTGGAFGGKEEYPSLIANHVALAAVKLGAPVQLVFDRREDTAYTTKRHPSEVLIKSYVEEGVVKGIEMCVDFDSGPYLGLSDVVLQRALLTMTGAYNIPNVSIRGRTYATNNVFTGAFRGFGAPQSIFALELHFNQLANKYGEDPLAFKSRHFVKQGDYSATSGRYVGKIVLDQMEKKLRASYGYDPNRISWKSERGDYCGIGISVVPHGGGFTGDGEASHIKAVVKLQKKSETIHILISNVEMGQGAKTALTKIVASVLECPMNRIKYENPDTSNVPDSGPTVASRTTMVVGELLYRAAIKLKERWQEGDIIVEEHFKQPDYVVWNQDKLKGNAYMSYSWSINTVHVEIDPITYEMNIRRIYGVYDVGMPIDEKLCLGQVHGGVIQGLGFATMEHMTSDEGKIVEDNFESYPIPTSMDIPKMDVEWVINKYQDGPFGAKGIGELTLVGIAPAVASAVENALGKEVDKLPITPEYIMEMIVSNE